MWPSMRLTVLAVLHVSGTSAFAESGGAVHIQTYLSLANVRAAMTFECRNHETCGFSIGDLEVRLSVGEHAISVRLRDPRHEFVFFNQDDVISVELGALNRTLFVYDQSSTSYVLNGANDPVGYIEIVADRN